MLGFDRGMGESGQLDRREVEPIICDELGQPCCSM